MTETQENHEQDPDFQAFFGGYIETMFWADAGPDYRLPDGLCWSALTAEERASVEEDCRSFYRQNKEVMARLVEEGKVRNGFFTHGHDFKLTRDGHGAGFWDRGYGEAGKQLTEAARAYGTEEILWSYHLPEEARA